MLAALEERASLLCALYEPEGGEGGGARGRCGMYEQRPLVCRLFGFAATRCKVAAAAEKMADAAKGGISLPVCLATDLVRLVHAISKRTQPAGGGVVSASLLNAKPAVGGIGEEPRVGGVLRVLFTVASDAVADTVVRWRHALRRCVDPSAAVFDVLSDREEARHQALWPAFVAAKAAGKRAQFHRARLVVDGERDGSHALAACSVMREAYPTTVAAAVAAVKAGVVRAPVFATEWAELHTCVSPAHLAAIMPINEAIKAALGHELWKDYLASMASSEAEEVLGAR
ncbi:hypothetical protein FOA52_006162 [Chlamydomonas sp. UWO 241]|nr:hypothetical protein FOA52_006162 [Chlamydomonas sp. UWO 241]